MKNHTLSFSIYSSLYALILLPFFAYGTYYLIYLGLSSLKIGLVLSLSYGLAALIQTPLAGLCDKKILSLRGLLRLSLLAFSLASLALGLNILPLISFSLALILLYLINPLLNALSVELTHQGYEVDFGLAKGLSSLSYALFSLIMGSLLALVGPKLVPFGSALGGLIFFLVLRGEKDLEDRGQEEVKKPSSSSLFRENPSLLGLLLGVSLVYANYSMFNSYLINTIRNIGGGESSLGLAVAIAAAAEVPSMVYFSRIMKNFKLNHLLVFSAVFFSLKTLVAYLAKSLLVLYLSQAMQLLSFGIYLPVSVYYMASITTREYRAQAQAAITGATTLGSLFASLAGGILIHYLGVSSMLLIAFFISCLGCLLIYIFSERIASEK